MVRFSERRGIRVGLISVGVIVIIFGFVFFPGLKALMSWSGMFEVSYEFVVPAGTEHYGAYWDAPRAGEKYYGYIIIKGGDNDIKFFITDPGGETIYDAGLVKGRHDFSFEATAKGIHRLHFDNRFSTESKTIRSVGEIPLLHETLWYEPIIIALFTILGLVLIIAGILGRRVWAPKRI